MINKINFIEFCMFYNMTIEHFNIVSYSCNLCYYNPKIVQLMKLVYTINL